jgi:hypothetical protein
MSICHHTGTPRPECSCHTCLTALLLKHAPKVWAEALAAKANNFQGLPSRPAVER